MATNDNTNLPAKPRTRHVCEWLGVTDVTLWRWRKAGIGFPEPVRLGNTRTLFYDRDELIAWVASRGEAKP